MTVPQDSDKPPPSAAKLADMLISSAEKRFVKIGDAANYSDREVAMATLEAALATYYLVKSRGE